MVGLVPLIAYSISIVSLACKSISLASGCLSYAQILSPSLEYRSLAILHTSCYRFILSCEYITITMADEYFYGITLSGAGATEIWDPETKADEYPRTNKLVLRQALLGHEAKEGEYNVVQVETMSIRDTVKTPVAVLKVGESRQCRLDLEFPDYPVTFTLIQGSGPVHLHGQHLFGALVEEFEDMDEMEEELLDEEEDEEQADGPKKRKISAGNKREHEDEEQEEEDGPKKKAKLANNAKGKAGAPKNKKK